MADTVRMIYGNKIFDVHNDEHTIDVCLKKGFSLVKEEKKPVEKIENKTTKKVTKK